MGGRGASSSGSSGGGGGLQGSTKQVSYANDLIKKAQSGFASRMNNMAHSSLAGQPGGRETLMGAYQDTWKGASNKASWWIQNRGKSDNILADQADSLFSSRMRNK